MGVQLMPDGAEPIGGHRHANDNGNVQNSWSPLPHKDPREGKCAGVTADGRPCKARAWAGGEYCYSHKAGDLEDAS